MSDPNFPLHAIDRLFSRFIAIYGAQKTATAWGNGDATERALVWHQALSKYPMTVVGEALRELAEIGTGWPPTLPEFVALVKSKVPQQMHARALPLPDRTAGEIAAGAAQMASLRNSVSAKGDGGKWAIVVIERFEAGDSVVSHSTYRLAQQALKNLGREVSANGSQGGGDARI
jgi:hypothetical protein